MLEKFNEFCSDFSELAKKDKYLSKVSDFFAALKEASNLDKFRESDTYQNFLKFVQTPDIADEIDLDDMIYTHIMLSHIVTLDDPEKRALAFDMLLEMHKGMMPNGYKIGDNDWKYLFARESEGTNKLPALTPYTIALFSGRKDVIDLLKQNQLDTQHSFYELITPGQTPKIRANNKLAIQFLLESPGFTSDNLINMITYPKLDGRVKDKYQIMAEEDPDTAKMVCEYILRTASKDEKLLPYYFKIIKIIDGNNIIKGNPAFAEVSCKYILQHPEQYDDLLPYFFQSVKLLYKNNKNLAESLINRLENGNRFFFSPLSEVVLHNKCTTVSINDITNITGLKIAMQALQYSESVNELVLTHIRSSSFRNNVINLLKNNTSIKSLFLNATAVNHTEIKTLAEALKVNSSVTKIYLHKSQIGDEGAKALAEALKVNSSVTNIYLHSNQIGDEGAKALAEALKVNSSVTNIYLHGNQIGDEGAKALAGALKVNSSIKELYIGGNQIGNEGGKALLDALQSNSSIKDLYVGANEIDRDIQNKIYDSIRPSKRNHIEPVEVVNRVTTKDKDPQNKTSDPISFNKENIVPTKAPTPLVNSSYTQKENITSTKAATALANSSHTQQDNLPEPKNYHSIAKLIIQGDKKKKFASKVYGSKETKETLTALLTTKFNERTDLHTKLDALDNDSKKQKFASRVVQAINEIDLNNSAKFRNLGYQRVGLYTIADLIIAICNSILTFSPQPLKDWGNSNAKVIIKDEKKFMQIIQGKEKAEPKRANLDKIIDAIDKEINQGKQKT